MLTMAGCRPCMRSIIQGHERKGGRMLLMRRGPYRDLEDRIGYRFRKRTWIEMALTHKSYRFENEGVLMDNQRLEFLGDALLGFVTAAHLYERFDRMDEGALTAMRSQLTSGKALAHIGAAVQLGAFLKMGKGEEQTGGRKRHSTLADALESVIGAAYLDGGLKAVQKIYAKLFTPTLEGLSGDVWNDNPKGKLQEHAQRNLKTNPRYRVVRRDGPPHATVFSVEVSVGPNSAVGWGAGRSKQEAEVNAARDILAKLDADAKDDLRPPS
ncbi:MAG: ribonuclease III [Verrucomicrobia bacterium]|nr:ribonuclease III [Verrucomicrobiota bacterium]